MKIVKAFAILAFAGVGFLAQAQSYVEQFSAAKPELERLMGSMQYREVIEKIQAILPTELPEFAKDPNDPQVGMNSYYDLGSIQDFHSILFRALYMSGDTQGAIDCLERARAIALNNAEEISGVVAPIIDRWSAAKQESNKSLEDIAPIKEQRELEKGNLEAKQKRNRKENERLNALTAELESIDKDIAGWEDNQKRAPLAVEQLRGYAKSANEDAQSFARDIEVITGDLVAENQEIQNKFDNDPAKYVAAAVNPVNLARLTNPREKVRFLNRLLFLDPQNEEVMEQIKTALSN